MWFQIFSYLKFLIKSTNSHGIHSPFIFNLITKALYTKTEFNTKSFIKSVQLFLQKNHHIIEVSDFGSGSNVLKNKQRKISDIAKIAGSSSKKAQLLAKLTSYFKPNSILEIGTSVGIGTAAMKIGFPNAKITTIEGCQNIAKVAEDTFLHFELTAINLKIGQFEQVLPDLLKNKNFDFIFFDGNHKRIPTINYFELCLNSASNNTIFVFDDIYYSKEMSEAWNIIKNNCSVTATIDLFHFGIVFFRKELTKQHFTIRT